MRRGQTSHGWRPTLPAAYTERGAGVERDADDNEIDVIENGGILDVLHAHEGLDTGETRGHQRVLGLVLLGHGHHSLPSSTTTKRTNTTCFVTPHEFAQTLRARTLEVL